MFRIILFGVRSAFHPSRTDEATILDSTEIANRAENGCSVVFGVAEDEVIQRQNHEIQGGRYNRGGDIRDQ